MSPSSADAKDYPSGQVPFVATGIYNMAPITVNPLQASWGAAAEQNGVIAGPTTAVSVDADGVGKCTPGASGVYAIGAWVYTNPNFAAMCSSIGPFGQPGCNSTVSGAAQLTCP